MATLTTTGNMAATFVMFSAFHMEVELNDGRRVSVPLDEFPVLSRATPAQRDNWILTDAGASISWPEIGQNITVGNICLASDSLSGRTALYA